MSCCGQSKFIRYSWTLIGLFMLVAVILSLTSCSRKESTDFSQPSKTPAEKQILYYTCGMHPSVKVSPEEYNKGNVNCPICNMKLTPVYKEQKKDIPEKSLEKKKALFYRNPMNPSITSKVPAKDEMGMDYIPVYEEPSNMRTNEDDDVISRVNINAAQARLAGVATDPARRVHLYKTIRTVGKVAYDPQLAITQEEFLSSLKALDKIQEGRIPEIKNRALSLVESAKRKLKLLGLSEEQINELERTKEIQSGLILPAKKMWVYAEAYEYELEWVKIGEKVEITISSIPGEMFGGVISSINPVLDPNTRSVKFRVEVGNPNLKLKPEMYVDVVIQSMYMSPEGEHMVLAIPVDAVLNTGIRKIVWIDKGEGEYEGREVQVGPEATAIVDGKETKFYPVLRGLKEEELVVTKANFLIDSQSQITGVAAGAYGGALGAEEKKTPPIHQH